MLRTKLLLAIWVLGALASRATAEGQAQEEAQGSATAQTVTPVKQETAATAGVPATSAASATGAAGAASATTAGAPCLTPGRRALAIAAAVGPGLFLHGAGSWTAKRPRAAKRLLGTQVLGLGLILAGGLPILTTYGSPKVTVPGVALAVTGFGVVAGGWVGDIWSAAGGDVGAGLPRAELPRFVEAGASWVRDDYHGDRGYLELGARWQWRRLAVLPHGRLGLDGRAGEGGVDAKWRLVGGPANGQLLERGHRLEVRLGAFGRFDSDDEIAALWQEAELGGRLELRAVDAALAGLFFEVSAGLGLEQTRYAPRTWDLGSLLLARNALGVYLGRGAGELSISYDQRRDDLVGGIFAGRAAGFLGHVGARLELRVRRGLGLRVEAALGTAMMTTVALRYGGS